MSYAVAPSYQNQLMAHNTGYRIQKSLQRTTTIINPEAVARGINFQGSVAGSSDVQGNGHTLKPESTAIAPDLSEALYSVQNFRGQSPESNSDETPNPHFQAAVVPSKPSCCGGSRNTIIQAAKEGPAQEDNVHTTQESDSSYGSISRSSNELSRPSPTDGNGENIAKSIPSRLTPQPHSSLTEQTTFYEIPPKYATSTNPLNPLQYAQIQRGFDEMKYSVPQYAPYGIFGSTAPSADGGEIANPVHNCNCGDTCACLACAAHPYNSTTRKHVEDLSAILACSNDDNRRWDQDSNSQGGFLSEPIDVERMTQVRSTVDFDKLLSPTQEERNAAALPSSNLDDLAEDLSKESNQQLQQPAYESSGYYTMKFPTNDDWPNLGCTDVSGTCECGNDCECIGCLTHTGHNNDMLPLNSATPSAYYNQPVEVNSPPGASTISQ